MDVIDREDAPPTKGVSHYRLEAEARPQPTCPTCGGTPKERRTQYGLRNDCCGLWSWDRWPLVDGATHAARNRAHKAIDPLWKDVHPTRVRRKLRSHVYRLLADELRIERTDCHVKMMDAETADRAVVAAAAIAAEIQAVLRKHLA